MRFSSIKKNLILVTILAVPGFLYYVLKTEGKNRYKPLPFFGPKIVASTFHSVHGKKIPDTIYHQVNDFKLLNQNGDTLSWNNFKGKIVIFYLFYTKGNHTMAISSNNKTLRDFEATYGKNRMINFVGLTVDPVYDTPLVLAPYAKGLSAKAGKLDLLTGDSTQVYHLINKELYLDALQKSENGERKFIFSNMFILLDSQHRIRGYYSGDRPETVSQLDDEIKVQITEELRNSHDGR